MIGKFKIRPENYKEMVDEIVSLLSTDVDCLRKGIAILQRLVDEVKYLKEVHVQ